MNRRLKVIKNLNLIQHTDLNYFTFFLEQTSRSKKKLSFKMILISKLH